MGDRGAELRSQALKRGFDMICATFAIVVAAIPMAVIAVAIRVTDGSPVIFSMDRPGRHGRIFAMYKFRTMRNATDAAGNLLPDEERITRLGSWLCATSLDELPELFNVVKGDMSLVGPRPLRTEYLSRYSARQARRHEVRPGITGLAQVEGRNAISWEERFELDVAYVESWTLLGDIKILVRTVGAVLGRKGISHEGHATMPEFRGSGE